MSSNDKLQASKLFNHLYEACHILRGPINQDEYKSYITPLLFYKRLSDVYDEEIEEALVESGGDIDYARFPENHRFIIPEGCHWNDVREKSENIGNAIISSMIKIERSNPDMLKGVFSSFDDANWSDKNKLSDSRLKDLVEHMSTIRFSNESYSADVLGDAYEYLLKKFADLSKKNAGEFYTPRAVVKLLVKILDPKPGETIYDPACGTGGMLIQAIKYINNDTLSLGKIYGQEKNLSTSATARMNLFLHGANDFKIVQGDTLRQPAFTKNDRLARFDCVIANPPFSLSNWGEKQWETDYMGRNIWGTPPNQYADYAWIQHMVSSMKLRTGRMAVVLPIGVLSRKGKEKNIRKKLIESRRLKKVIVLAPNLFYGANISTMIFVLENNTDSDEIHFIDGSEMFTPDRAQNYMTETDISEIFKAINNDQNIPGIKKIVRINEIQENGYDLNISRYVKPANRNYSYNISENESEVARCIKSVRESIDNVKISLEEVSRYVKN